MTDEVREGRADEGRRPSMPLVRPMQARETHERHRVATPLELFFDLCFVVAVAQAAAALHHDIAEDHIGHALVAYPMVFFAIWWAWMNFTWFASAYDTDDVTYRLAVFVQMAGVLILAAGVPRAFADKDFVVVTLGYVVMRVALISQWLRAARGHPECRQTNRRYAAGIGLCTVGWIALMLLPDGVRLPGFIVMVVAELSVPVWAERSGVTPWHAHHITERYGLFTIIVLGESILAATVAVQVALDAGQPLADLAGVAVGGLLTVFSMWWLYFSQPSVGVMERARTAFEHSVGHQSFVWGYGHFFVFSAAAAVGAGVAVAVDQATDHAEISVRGAGLAVAIPVALYLLSVWLLHGGARRAVRGGPAMVIGAVVIVVTAAIGLPVLGIGVLMAVLVAIVVAVPARAA